MDPKSIKQAIDAAVDYLTKNPDEAKYTDSVATAKRSSPDGLAFDISGPNGAWMSTDMPTSVGGANNSPSPGWYLRAAEASCVATLIAMRAAQLEVTLDELEVTVDSESNDFGILGIGDEVPAGPLSTRVHVRIGSSATTDEGHLREIVDWAVKHCPVTDAVSRAIPLNVEIETGL
jgi:uncharacterized OsmC-like protein